MELGLDSLERVNDVEVNSLQVSILNNVVYLQSNGILW